MFYSDSSKKNFLKWEKEAERGDNPLLAEWVKLARNSWEMSALLGRDQRAWEKKFQEQLSDLDSSPFTARQKLVHKYSWAIPCDEALDEIAKYSPIIEIGEGHREGFTARNKNVTEIFSALEEELENGNASNSAAPGDYDDDIREIREIGDKLAGLTLLEAKLILLRL